MPRVARNALAARGAVGKPRVLCQTTRAYYAFTICRVGRHLQVAGGPNPTADAEFSRYLCLRDRRMLTPATRRRRHFTAQSNVFYSIRVWSRDQLNCLCGVYQRGVGPFGTLVNSDMGRGPSHRSSAIPIDELPQFDVRRLLKSALEQIDSADHRCLSDAVTQAARQEIVAILGLLPIKEAQPTYGHDGLADADAIVRRIAKSLLPVKDAHVERARLALISAADMLRPAPATVAEKPDLPAQHQPEIPKVGSTDAPGG